MNKLDLTKNVVRLVVGTGAGKIAKDIIKNNTTPKSQVDVVTYALGAVAIGGVVADAAKTYTDTKIDEYVTTVNKIRGKITDEDGNLKSVEELKEDALSELSEESDDAGNA